jgi:hypothetical protein
MPSNGKNKRSERKRTTLSMVAFRSALTNAAGMAK